MPQGVTGQTFEAQTIRVDGTLYTDCVFDRCLLVFDGSGFRFDRCTFSGCEWQLTGPAATTIDFLAGLWPDRTQDGVFAAVFEHIAGDKKVANGLMNIRKRSI